jgi:serine/threonine protein kinase
LPACSHATDWSPPFPFAQLLRALLAPNPADRPTTQETLAHPFFAGVDLEAIKRGEVPFPWWDEMAKLVCGVSSATPFMLHRQSIAACMHWLKDLPHTDMVTQGSRWQSRAVTRIDVSCA